MHPRVTGYCDNDFKGFPTLEELYKAAEAKGFEEKDLDTQLIKSEEEKTSPPKGSNKFYAVAYGKSVGVFDCY